MKDTAIILKWIEDGREHRNEIVRNEFYEKLNNLIKEYPENNEISKQLVKVIPEINEIFINRDFNRTQDVPSIAYKGKEGGLIKINRWHKIVWRTINEYCI